jgi:hypothetical protein
VGHIAIVQMYRNIQDWCVEYVTDFSYVFVPHAYEDDNDRERTSTPAFAKFLKNKFNANLSNWKTAKSMTTEGIFQEAGAFVSYGLNEWNGKPYSSVLLWLDLLL